MKATDFNQFSDALVRKLKPDERATYRVTNVRPDPDNAGRWLVPAALQIPSTDIIYDKKKGDFVPIAAIERTDLDGNPVYANIVFSSVNLGYLFLNGNNALHQKMYQYIELCNFNESNKDRNQEIEVLFYRVDTKKDAMEERMLRKLIVKAVNAALELDDVKAKEAAMAVGIDAESIEEIRNLLEDYAEENPEEFLEIIERASLANETLLKDAVKAGFIKNNVNASQFEWTETGKEIYKYKKGSNKNYYKELADYLESENPEELNAIRTRLG